MDMKQYKYDYISILASGKCGFECSFCVGNNIREEKKPYFSSKYNSFIDLFSKQTGLLSVSGSTSDPSFIDLDVHKNIVYLAKKENNNIRVNVHTRTLSYEILKKLDDIYDKVVISIDETFSPMSYLSEFKNIRYSIVVTNRNFNVFTMDWFENIFNITNHSAFTLRYNIFEDKVNLPKFGKEVKTNFLPLEAIQYKFHDGLIVLWDFERINKNISVRYLWGSDIVSSQCEWDKLYN